MSVLIQNERESCCFFAVCFACACCCSTLFCFRRVILTRANFTSLSYHHPFTNQKLSCSYFLLFYSCADAGIHGFIVVDLPPIEAMNFRQICDERDMCLVPLVSPTTTDERLAIMGKMAKGYVYCVSLNGVTGARTDLPPNLNTFLNRVRVHMR